MTTFSVFAPQGATNANTVNYLGLTEGVGQSIAIAELAKKSGLSLLITPDTPTALTLEAELNYLLKDQLPVWLFPDRETLPYDSFSPHQDLISQRLATLSKLLNVEKALVIVPITTLMMRLPPKSFLAGNVMLLKQGDKYSLQQMRTHLVNAGYHLVSQVYEHGEFAIRGAILDIFPMGTNTPLRIELFDDEIESIRHFDPETQLSSDVIDQINMLPANEFPTDDKSIETFRQHYRQQFGVTAKEPESVYQQVSRKIMPAGIENYLPLFFDETATLFDYLNENTQLITLGDLEHAANEYLAHINLRYEDRRVDPLRPLLEPKQLFLLTDQLFSQLKNYCRTQIAPPNTHKHQCIAATTPLPPLAINYKLNQPLTLFSDYITDAKRVLICAESEGRREALLELFSKIQLKPKLYSHFYDFISDTAAIGMIVSPLAQGCIINDLNLSIICETELFGQRISQHRRREKQRQISNDALIKDLAELKVGQPIVHLEHGVALYQGLETLDTGGIVAEYLKLEYANGDKLYVPVSSLHLISRYNMSNDETPPLNRLGNETWSKAKNKAIERIRDVAAELLDVYAKRQSRPGYACEIDKADYDLFSQGFPFEETLDQETAIESVLNDMCSPTSMDRLVCGDVGFGKTEVAMRAAFVAVNAGKQVAVLVPTTLLAQQHYENFCNRFADWPVEIDVISRFRTAKEQAQVVTAMAENKVDIIIGTHKLLNSEIKFDNLGLLIIDEEHRFGVRQKEKIKALRANIDILTLTATPIPRTLNMAMSGMRDLSIIATPPAKRLAVKTFVREYDDASAREAIQREILRGGQVYFLHNNVDSIETMADSISELVPDARVIVAHGQMRERDLERVMSDFYHRKYNVLVCTTIIETGIDVPNANTIIINRADMFGLAQLHQLRGRVGRSHHQAYAYLMTPHPKRMTSDARKRLEAIQALEDLGAGFMLATQDLEIRGAGELLGDEQSGHISKIGFTLYMEMLEGAVAALKDGKEPSLAQMLNEQTEIELRIPALLPEDYVSDVNIRLSLYKRIANCKTETALDELKVELIDRFGLLPESTKNLMQLTLYKHQATAIGIKKLDVHAKGGTIEFNEQTKIDPSFIIELLQSQPQIYRMEGPNKLKFAMGAETNQQRLDLVGLLLSQFAQHCKGEK